MTALPPKGFVGAGTVLRAERNRHPAFSTAAYSMVLAAPRYQRGLHYQQVVEHALSAWANQRSEWFPKDAYPDNRIKRSAVTVEFGPWFRFTSTNQPSVWRWCQPDVLIVSESAAVVLEIKLTLEPRAWWQLAHLYRPVVSMALERFAYGGIICKSADLQEVSARINGVLMLDRPSSPAGWLDALARGGADTNWKIRGATPVLQWKRPSIDSATSESAARINGTDP